MSGNIISHRDYCIITLQAAIETVQVIDTEKWKYDAANSLLY